MNRSKSQDALQATAVVSASTTPRKRKWSRPFAAFSSRAPSDAAPPWRRARACLVVGAMVAAIIACVVVARRSTPARVRDPPTARVPWRVVTGARTTHRFFDSSPLSPSGRFLVATATRREGPRDVTPGDAARVVVIDLAAGDAVVYSRRTRAWDAQLGAQAQWGATDDELYFNDVVDARARPARRSGSRRRRGDIAATPWVADVGAAATRRRRPKARGSR